MFQREEGRMSCLFLKIIGALCGRTTDNNLGYGCMRDELMWCRELGRHASGEFSMAAIQANRLLEDGCQIESGTHGTFVGVYDGHGGPEVSRYIAENIFQLIKRFLDEKEGMMVDILRKAFSATENGFLSIVKKNWSKMPLLATVGSCCLTGFICGGMLYVANVGDSRAVLGRFNLIEREAMAVQLTTEHNACQESVRQELRLLHPDDPKVVDFKNGAWRVKGILQVSRSIGDAYLKKAEFNKVPLLEKFRLSEPISKPFLSSEPSIVAHKICPEDLFVIFASDGLWEHISNQEAVDIVQNFSRSGIARRLVETAVRISASKREIGYSELITIDRGPRRHFHDDITVVVLFIDHSLASNISYSGPMLSIIH